MYKVLTCLTVEHDWRLVMLAAGVCFLASGVAISLFHRAQVAKGRARLVWLGLDAAAAGFGNRVDSAGRMQAVVAPIGAREIDHLAAACERIRAEYPTLELCLSLGLMSEDQARRLKDGGAGWINHNLNTSRRFYPEICTTHTWDDRVRTIENVRAAGLSVCSGGIIGMGETDDDVLDLAYATRRVRAESVPLNFLHPIAGTPLEHAARLTPERCLKTACLFRLLNPRSEVRAAGGRELNLGERQADLFNAVNSIFVNGYLTTAGWGIGPTRALIEDAGFEVEVESPAAA